MPEQLEWNFIFLIYADLRTPSNDPGSDSVKFGLLKTVLESLPIPATCRLFTIKDLVTINNMDQREVMFNEISCERLDMGGWFPLEPSVFPEEMDQKPSMIGHFIARIGNEFPARKTALFTWDHGNVFGINKMPVITALKAGDVERDRLDEFDISGIADYYINPVLFREQHPLHKDNVLDNILAEVTHPNEWLQDFMGPSFRKAGFKQVKDPVVDMLTNEMLADAIRDGGFSEQYKLDLVCMMNCCMGNLHTEFALHTCVQHLVAPQTWIYFPGYDYLSIFRTVHDHPGITPKDLANLIVATCQADANSPTPLVPKASIEGIFAIDLAGIDEVTECLRENVLFENDMATRDPAYKTGLFELFHMPLKEFENSDNVNYRLIDLYHLYYYRKRYFSPIPDSPLKNYADAYRAFYKGRIDEFIGRFVCIVNKHAITGFSLSLPTKRIFNDPRQVFIKLYYREGRYQSALVRYLQLDRLMENVYDLVSS